MDTTASCDSISRDARTSDEYSDDAVDLTFYSQAQIYFLDPKEVAVRAAHNIEFIRTL